VEVTVIKYVLTVVNDYDEKDKRMIGLTLPSEAIHNFVETIVSAATEADSREDEGAGEDLLKLYYALQHGTWALEEYIRQHPSSVRRCASRQVEEELGS
jgi:hypothetical protein